MTLAARLKALTGRRHSSVTPAEAATMVDDGALLLDVRERSEFNAGHAPQARNIPLRQLAGRLDGLPGDRTIVAVCRSGARSTQATRLLVRQGYEVVNLSGGMNAWRRAGLPVVAGGGRRGRVV